MDALAILTGDHNRVRGLFSMFEEAHEKQDTATMHELARRIFEQLEVHTAIEEQTFYPAVKDASHELGELIAEGVEEHNVAKRLIEECQALEPGTEEWVAKMTVLIESVEHHADEEESEMFPQVRTALQGDMLEQLGTTLTAGKRSLGAPTPDEVVDLTKTALMEKAKAQAIPGRSKMKQEELALAIDPRF